MFSEVQTALRLDENDVQGKFAHIVEEDDHLASFLIHHFIHMGIHKKAKVVIVGLENTFGHYNSVGLKIGNNLFKLKESGNVTYIEAFSKIASLIDANELSSYDVVIEHLLEEIKKEMSENAFVILDKISIFYNLGMPSKTTMKFIRELQKHAVKKGCLIVTCSKSYSKLGKSDQDDFVHDDDDAFLSYLSHCATLNIVVRPLSSGKSMNVTGNMIFLWNLPTNHNLMPKYYQFRLEEKDVKVFSAGTSNAVL